MIFDYEEFVNEALDRGFVECDGGYIKQSHSKTSSVYFEFLMVGAMEIERISIFANQKDRDCVSERKFVFGNLDVAFKKLTSLDSELFVGDNKEMSDQENVRAARMIHELRTLTLGNDDKLLVLAKDHLDQVDMESLANCLSRWVGDKGLHKVLVVKGVEMIKIQGDKNGKQ